MNDPEVTLHPAVSPTVAAAVRAPVDSLAARDPFPWTKLAEALASLGTIGASIGLALAMLSGRLAELTSFFDKNTLSKVIRDQLFLGFLIGAATTLGPALVVLAWRRRAAVLPLLGISRVALPLAVSFSLPPLFSTHWHDTPLVYLVFLVVVTFALEWTVRRSLDSIPPWLSESFSSPIVGTQARALLPLLVVLAGCIFYSVYFSYYTLLNHRRLNTAGFDLGINVNWCYNAIHGHPFRATVLFGPDGGNMIAGHAIFAVFLWLPLFAIHPTAETLLVFQSVSVGFAALSLFLFARTQIPRWSAAAVAVLYLFYAPLHGPNFYDFHELLPPIGIHFLLYWALATRRNALTWVLVPVLWAFREDVSIGVAVVGMFLVLSGARPRAGVAIAVSSVVWFYIDKFQIMPRAGSWWFAGIYKDLSVDGAAGYGSILQTILINPVYFLSTLLKEVKIIYFLHIFAPLALLPARRLSIFFVAAPGFFFTLMTTAYAPTISIAFQYTTHWVPYVFGASVLMLRLLGREADGANRRRAAIVAMSLAMMSHSYVFGAILQHTDFIGGFSKVEFTMTEEEKARYQDLRAVAAMIPVTASVAATENENPHVAARRDAFTLKDNHGDAEYLLVNSQRMTLGNTTKNMRDVFGRAAYGLVAKRGIFYLFRRGHVSPETESAKAALGLRDSKGTP